MERSKKLRDLRRFLQEDPGFPTHRRSLFLLTRCPFMSYQSSTFNYTVDTKYKDIESTMNSLILFNNKKFKTLKKHSNDLFIVLIIRFFT